MKVYKLIIAPYYPSYSVFSKEANDDTDDWKVVSNGASTRDVVKRLVIEEVERMFGNELINKPTSKLSKEQTND